MTIKIFYKLLQFFFLNCDIGSLLQVTAALSQITVKIFYNLRQKLITNDDKMLLQITAALVFEKLKIITDYVKFYYILRQFLKFLQITATLITN